MLKSGHPAVMKTFVRLNIIAGVQRCMKLFLVTPPCVVGYLEWFHGMWPSKSPCSSFSFCWMIDFVWERDSTCYMHLNINAAKDWALTPFPLKDQINVKHTATRNGICIASVRLKAQNSRKSNSKSNWIDCIPLESRSKPVCHKTDEEWDIRSNLKRERDRERQRVSRFIPYYQLLTWNACIIKMKTQTIAKINATT